MRNPYQNDNDNDNLDNLLRQVDELLVSSDDDSLYNQQYDTTDSGDFDPDDFDSDEFEDLDDDDEPMLYQNYSNNYGASVQNFANGYGGRQIHPAAPAPASPSIPAYNADFKKQASRDPIQPSRAPRQDSLSHKAVRKKQKTYYEDDSIPTQYAPKPPKNKKRRKMGCGCTTGLVVLVILVAGLFGLFHMICRPPKADTTIGSRKRDTATILLCGVDEGGTRTDTMMLMYLSGSENKVGLLSIPRDTYFVTTGGYDAKLNSAYGLNNCGEEGMEGLFDHIEDIIGYRPDGYLLVDFSMVPKITDLMGGVQVDVPGDCSDGTISLNAGLQTLNGEELLMLLRHRKTYANADLGRVEVQRDIIRSCMEQWISIKHLPDALSALNLMRSDSLSSLEIPNYLWMAKTILLNLNNFSTDTLPGYATMMDGISYYILEQDQVAQMINESYNPYRVEISADSLHIDG